MIGHEGVGSILSLLKKKGLANNLNAGVEDGGLGFAFYEISIELTESGLGKILLFRNTIIFFFFFRLFSNE